MKMKTIYTKDYNEHKWTEIMWSKAKSTTTKNDILVETLLCHNHENMCHVFWKIKFKEKKKLKYLHLVGMAVTVVLGLASLQGRHNKNDVNSIDLKEINKWSSCNGKRQAKDLFLYFIGGTEKQKVE